MSGLREKSNINHLTKRLGYLKLYFTCVCGFLWSVRRARNGTPGRHHTVRSWVRSAARTGRRGACGLRVRRVESTTGPHTAHGHGQILDMDMRTSMCDVVFALNAGTNLLF